jgi:hypothetical protein
MLSSLSVELLSVGLLCAFGQVSLSLSLSQFKYAAAGAAIDVVA